MSWQGNIQARIGSLGAGDKTVNYAATPTLAQVKKLRAAVSTTGGVAIEWQTTMEVGALGFHLERYDDDSGLYERVTDELVPSLGLLGARQGGKYSVIDSGAQIGGEYSYQLVEEETWGRTRIHGPYEVVVDQQQPKARSATDTAFTKVTGNGKHQVSARRLKRSNTRTTAASVATTGLARIDIDANALYEIDAASIAVALGRPPQEVRRAIQRGTLALSTRGQPVDWEASKKQRGIRFYGEAPAENPYAAASVYWLALGPGNRMRTRKAGGADPIDAQVIANEMRLEQDVFANIESASDPDSDYWYAGVMKGGANWNRVTTDADLPHLAPGIAADLAIDLLSIREVTNSVKVFVNECDPLEPSIWVGASEYQAQVSIPAGCLQVGANTITIETQPGGGGTSYVYLDGMTLSYQRYAMASNGTAVAVAPDSGILSLDGFDNNAVAVYEIGTPPMQLSRVGIDRTPAGWRATFAATPGVTYLAVQNGAESVIEPVAAEIFSYEPDLDVDYLIIADRRLDAGAQTLAEYRRGNGLATRVVWTDEVDMIVNHGVASPYNIREFLKRVEADWGVRYVVFAGDACHDYRGITNLCENLVSTLLVPTPFGIYACDTCLGDTDGDGQPNVKVSRIPARTNEELQGYVAKVIRYERSLGDVERAAFLVADRNDPKAGQFMEDTQSLAEQISDASPDALVETLPLDEVDDVDEAKARFLDRLGMAGVWSNYVGHGGGTTLSNILSGGDSDEIVGYSWILSAMTCAAAWHDSPYWQSIAEELVLNPDGGPAVAYAPSGLSLNVAAVQLNRTLLDEVFRANQQRIGDAVAEALDRDATNVADWMRHIYHIIGDVYLINP